MNKSVYFDVLIVYTQALARSASSSLDSVQTPFPEHFRNAPYNIAYGYFLKICSTFGLTAAFTTSADIVGAGTCSSFWTYSNNRWSKSKSRCFSPLIFDKFSPVKSVVKASRKLLFSSPNVKPFNDSDLFNLFLDKQKTYKKLSMYAIPTVSLNGTTHQSIADAYSILTKLIALHPNPDDFTKDIILKARFGSCGRQIYKFKPWEEDEMARVISKQPSVSFILQPFVKFDHGFTYGGNSAPTDIRFIYLGGHIVQSYIRVAKAGEFRCNECQGGVSTYVSLADLPKDLVAKANVIAHMLNKKYSLYTLDFIISNNGNSYFLEGNTSPGLVWNLEINKEEIECKKVIKMIVKELAVRSMQKGTSRREKSDRPSYSALIGLNYPLAI